MNYDKLADELEQGLEALKAKALDPAFRNNKMKMGYLRQQISTTETAIFALRNGRVAKNDKEIEQFIQKKN